MRSDPVDQQPQAEREPGIGILRPDRRADIGTRGVPLQPGLLVDGGAENEIDHRAGGRFSAVGGHPGIGALTGVVGTVSAWITGHQLAIAITALGLILVTAIATLTRRERRHTTTDTADDCCAPRPQPEENADQVGGPGSR